VAICESPSSCRASMYLLPDIAVGSAPLVNDFYTV